MNPQVHHRVHNSQPPVPIRIASVHIIPQNESSSNLQTNQLTSQCVHWICTVCMLQLITFSLTNHCHLIAWEQLDLEINTHKLHDSSHSAFHFEEAEKLMSNRTINSTRDMQY
jgi:hypothetical protein